MNHGKCDKTRLLDPLENLSLFSEDRAGWVNIIGRKHQFLGVNNGIASMLADRGQIRLAPAAGC